MEFFELVLQWSIYLSVATTAVVIYLNINKMWSRKHEPVVADSVSVAAQLIGILTIIPFLISYSFQRKYLDVLFQFFWFIYTAFLILTGIGFWVKEHQYLGVWQKLVRTLSQERNEVGNLVKSLGSSTEKKQLLAILHRLAWLDDGLDDREHKYIQTFANQLEIESEIIFDCKPPEEGIDKFHSLCQSVQDYLAVEPPMEQVKLLGDLVQALITVDGRITPEEEVIAEEITGIVNAYTNSTTVTSYSIVIHPKNQEQKKAILITVPEAKEEYVLGDRALIAGAFQTQRYAEIISEYYREQGWFTVVHKNPFIQINATEPSSSRAEYKPSVSS